MVRYIGVELGNKIIRLVDMDFVSKENFKINDAYERVLTDAESGSVDSVAAVLDEIFRKNRVAKKNVAVAIDSYDSFIRELQLPFIEEEAINKVIKFEFESKVHTASAEDMVVDYCKISEKGKTSTVLAVGVLKTTLNKINQITKKSKIEPLIFNVDLFALYNTASFISQEKNYKNALFIHIGLDDIKILAISDEKLVNIRSLFLPLPQDEKGEDSYLSQIESEIKNSLLYYPPNAKIDSICFSGDVELIKKNLKSLAENLGINVEIVSSEKRFEWKAKGDNVRFEKFVIPIGIGLQLGNITPVKANYRKEEFKYGSIFKYARSQFMFLLTLIFLSEMLVSYKFYNDRNQRKSKYDKLLNECENIFREVFPGEKISSDIFNQWKALKKNLEEKTGIGEETPFPVMASKYLICIYQTLDEIAKTTEFFFYTRILVDPASYNISVEGYTDDPKKAESAYNALCGKQLIKENYDDTTSKMQLQKVDRIEQYNVGGHKFIFTVALKRRK